MNMFSLWKALPDLEANAFGWCVDPLNSHEETAMVRVFVMRNTGTHAGPLNMGSALLEPTGMFYKGTAKALAITVDKEDKVQKHAAVDRFAGKGGRLGAVTGMLAAIGLPAPKPCGSVFKFSMWPGNTFGTQFGPETISNDEDIPSWCTNPLQGNENC